MKLKTWIVNRKNTPIATMDFVACADRKYVQTKARAKYGKDTTVTEAIAPVTIETPAEPIADAKPEAVKIDAKPAKKKRGRKMSFKLMGNGGPVNHWFVVKDDEAGKKVFVGEFESDDPSRSNVNRYVTRTYGEGCRVAKKDPRR
jgi:hypothetical protein